MSGLAYYQQYCYDLCEFDCLDDRDGLKYVRSIVFFFLSFDSFVLFTVVVTVSF